MALPPSPVGCIQSNIWSKYFDFLIARLARSDPRNRFSVGNIVVHLLNFSVFHHVFISSLDMFKNCINSYHIESKQV